MDRTGSEEGEPPVEAQIRLRIRSQAPWADLLAEAAPATLAPRRRQPCELVETIVMLEQASGPTAEGGMLQVIDRESRLARQQVQQAAVGMAVEVAGIAIPAGLDDAVKLARPQAVGSGGSGEP